MFLKTISLVAFGIASLLTLYFFLVTESFNSIDTTPGSLQWTYNLPQDDTSFGGLFFSPDLDDSLPYYKYRILADSVEKIKNVIESNNKSLGDSKGFGVMSVNALRDQQPTAHYWPGEHDELRQLSDSMLMLNSKSSGLPKGKTQDSIKKLSGDLLYRYNVRRNQIERDKMNKEEKRYYFGLTGYQTDAHRSKFFLDKGTYNLAYVVWDRVEKRAYDSTKVGHYERKRIPVRYAADDKKILIPITKQQYRFTAAILEACSFATIFLFVYVFLGLPVQIIINISKGKAFTLKNIRRFKVMAIVLCIFSLCAVLHPYLLHWIFRDLVPDEFELKFFQGVFSQLSSFLTALALFLIGKAFERGYYLQQESALTIKYANSSKSRCYARASSKMSLSELSRKVDITLANLSILKSGKAKAIRFSTLEAICEVLDCQPGDILEHIDQMQYKKLMRL